MRKVTLEGVLKYSRSLVEKESIFRNCSSTENYARSPHKSGAILAGPHVFFGLTMTQNHQGRQTTRQQFVLKIFHTYGLRLLNANSPHKSGAILAGPHMFFGLTMTQNHQGRQKTGQKFVLKIFHTYRLRLLNGSEAGSVVG